MATDFRIPNVAALAFIVLAMITESLHAEPGSSKPAEAPSAAASIEGKRAGEERVICGIRFCWIPSGSFKMGSPAEEPGRNPYYEQQVDVELDGFWMAKFELTNAEYAKALGGKVSRESPENNHPKTELYWDQIQRLSALLQIQLKASERSSGWQLRAPTEAEWEYACRAGTTTAFYWGDEASQDEANIKAEGAKIAEVGSYQKSAPHPWGLCDMHGNVSEWCQDAFLEKLPGGKNPYQKPGKYQIIRGGSWMSDAKECRSASRGGVINGRFDQGVRLVFSPVEIK